MGSAVCAQSETYGWQERWDQYVNRTYSWKRVGAIVGETAFEDTFRLSKCGRPPFCFPHHLGGALARRTARNTMESGAAGLLHEDLRRTPSGLTGFRQRFAFAMTHAALAKDADGDWRPAYSRYIGTMSAVVVTTAWDGRPMTSERVFGHFGISAANYFQ